MVKYDNIEKGKGKSGMKFDLVIHGGKLVIPKQGVLEGDIGIKDGKICALLERGGDLSSDSFIDAQGLHVFPGVIEPHSHIGLGDGTRDLATETKAAAQGVVFGGHNSD